MKKAKILMSPKISEAEAVYFLGLDGGGSKTDCILADAEGRVLSRATGGPSNPVRVGYTRAWFALSEAVDSVLGHQKIHAEHIRGICAGLGGAGRKGVVRRVEDFLERSFPNAAVQVTTDLEIAFDAAFGAGEGIILVAGTGSMAMGRDASGRVVRAGGRGPWISDEGSGFDIGRQAFVAMVRAEENRGPATALSQRLFEWYQTRDWETLYDRITKNPDDVFPKIFPLVAQLADEGDEVSRTILSGAAVSLAGLVGSVVRELGWDDRPAPLAKAGGMHARSRFFDAAIEKELQKIAPQAEHVEMKNSPAEAAVRLALRLPSLRENSARI
jgi:glucosamine kinase